MLWIKAKKAEGRDRKDVTNFEGRNCPKGEHARKSFNI